MTFIMTFTWENLQDKKQYVIHTRNLKQVLNHRLVLKAMYSVVKFNPKIWLSLYIDIKDTKTQILKNKPVYLDLSTLQISNIVMYGFLHNKIRPNYEEQAKSWHTDTNSFIVYIKMEEIFVDIAKM